MRDQNKARRKSHRAYLDNFSKVKRRNGQSNQSHEKKGHIRDSQSTWCNNIRPVEKSDGSVRIATNLVALNKLVELEQYSLPNIEEIIFRLHGKKWFSKLDLKDGFFQIPLREEDKHKTAFRYDHKLKEWNVMPMGFKNAPAIFQRFMDHILREELGKTCFCYVDDILVFGSNEEEHDHNLKIIQNVLNNYGMEINENKSKYKVQEVVYLGYLLKENKVEKLLDNEEAIKNYPRPKTKEELQSFLGMVNYCWIGNNQS